jgi:hypothetical protein
MLSIRVVARSVTGPRRDPKCASAASDTFAGVPGHREPAIHVIRVAGGAVLALTVTAILGGLTVLVVGAVVCTTATTLHD